MLEPLVRNNLPHLHGLYDRMPAPALNLLVNARGWLLTSIRYSPRMYATLQHLRSSERWTADDVARLQLANLQNTIDHARQFAPRYREYAPITLRTPDDLRRLPILSRETLRKHTSGFLAGDVPARSRIRAGTTGTTGANLTVTYTQEALADNWAFLLRQWAWAGVAPRSPRVTLFGARILPTRRNVPPYWTHNGPERQLLMSIFHMSDATAPAYLDCLARRSGEILEGFPSVLSILADFAERSGITIPMRAVFTSGEPLYPEARAKIEKIFRSRVFDSYGMTELCGLVQQCAAGAMHLAPEYGYLEIIDDAGDPVKPGEEGFLVWTGFVNRAMPLIRYRVGDRGRWESEAECPCGVKFPRLVPTITRESDLLRLRDGRVFSPRALNQLLKDTTAFRFCQFVHEPKDRVVLRAVGSGKKAADEAFAVKKRLAELLGASVSTDVLFAEAPISRAGGKIPLIVNQVNS